MSSEKKSNFAVTCSLLSQYLKKKGSIRELRLDPPQEPTTTKGFPPTTMNLLGGIDNSTEDKTNICEPQEDENATKAMELFPPNDEIGSSDKKIVTKEPKNAQLTIFYSGKVLVFDNFPSEKIDDLMKFASKGISTSPSVAAAAEKPENLPENNPSTSNSAAAPSQANPELPMPIARRASLHRFFEKRKDRINLKAPYQVNGASIGSPSKPEGGAGKPEGGPSWLG